MKLSGRNSFNRVLTKYSGFILCLLIQTNSLLYSQHVGKDALRIHEKSFSEVVYINTDRDFYVAGEKVWFKINKINGLKYTPVNLSKVVYVDLLDPENNPVDQAKIEIDGFSGSGDLILPDTLRTGNYILRSYTNWMQNFSKDLFACKSISVINPFDKITNLIISNSSPNPDTIIFYPEGGNLLAGFATRLGFKITDRNRNPVKMKGILVNDENDTLCHVQTGNNGYGFVLVSPSDNNRLFLISSDKNLHWKFPLPDVQKEGVILSAIPKSESSPVIAKLNFSSDNVLKGKNIFLEIHSAGLSGFRKTIISEKDHELSISENDLPYGISHLQVIDEDNNILTYRWISKESANRINYKINLQKNEYAPRENIKVNISATDNSGLPVESDFSISVIKAITANRKRMSFDPLRQLPGMGPVIKDCNLTDVNDYLIFYKPDGQVSDHNGNPDGYSPDYLPELEGHLISGNIKDKISGEPLRNENIVLSFIDKAALCHFAKTDSNGNFWFVSKEQGRKEIVIQQLISSKDCYLDLNNPFATRHTDYDHGLFCLDTSKLDNINNTIISAQISNIYEPFYQNSVTSSADHPKQNFYGKPDKTILMSEYIELKSVEEIVAELIPGVTITKNNGKINFRFSKPYPAEPFKNSPLVLVDGVPVNDFEKVIAISSRDIEKIDVLNDRYYISGIFIDGILHFITNKGNLSAYDLDMSVFRMEYDLLKKKANFYSPDYSLDSLKNNHLPDFRNTLYWNPDLHTDKSGKVSVEFYSSDESEEYIIYVEGISRDGKTGGSSLPLIIRNR